MRLIDADAILTIRLYDDEHEAFVEKRDTIADMLDFCTIEGCPEPIDAQPVVHAKWRSERTIGGFGPYRCTKCHGIAGELMHGMKYCKWCGATMDGGPTA